MAPSFRYGRFTGLLRASVGLALVLLSGAAMVAGAVSERFDRAATAQDVFGATLLLAVLALSALWARSGFKDGEAWHATHDAPPPTPAATDEDGERDSGGRTVARHDSWS